MRRPRWSRWRAPTRNQALLLLAVAVVTLVGSLTLVRLATSTAPPVAGAVVPTSATPRADLPGVALADLPERARETLVLIDRGGPYPYRQDGTVFGNAERRLPARPAGYYREYTVAVEGSRERGTWRLVIGELGDVYYTEDHYRTFRQVLR